MLCYNNFLSISKIKRKKNVNTENLNKWKFNSNVSEIFLFFYNVFFILLL